MNKILLLSFLILAFNTQAQDMKLPYEEIPDAPNDYSSGNVIGRIIDGLGYRYHWATKDLTQSDLDYKITEESRSILETLQHVYGMSEMILEAPKGAPSIRPKDFSTYTYTELRKKTLENLEAASNLVKGKNAEQVAIFKITFQNGQQQTDFPYWNMLNGMLSDCISHIGQIAILRRANGNPQDARINVFTGKNRS